MPQHRISLALNVSHSTCWYLFWLAGLCLCLLALGGHFFSSYFSYFYRVDEMPVFLLVGGLVGGGIIFVLLRFLLPHITQHSERTVLSFAGIKLSPLCGIFLIGLLARLLLLFSEPILEDDYQRYLWDGGVLAHGISPYKYSPEAIMHTDDVPLILQDLAAWAAPLPERINHPELRTIYPAGAEALFALSHIAGPWSLTAWRLLILLAELCSFAFLTLLVLHVGRSPLWLSLYWWNPLVIKELINSAHMEGVLMPFLLGGIYFAIKGFLPGAALMLSLAASIKFWPALLLPLIWQRMLHRPFVLAASIIVSLIIGGLIVWPYISSGLNESSGLVAYGMKWKTNSAFFPTFEKAIIWLLNLFSFSAELGAIIARFSLGLALIFLVLLLTFYKGKKHSFYLFQFTLVCSVVFLLSPAQFPWYFVWIAPFLVFYPLWGFIILVPLMGVYYLGFYLFTEGLYQDHSHWLALLIWVPVWCALLWELMKQKEIPFCAMAKKLVSSFRH